MKTPNTDSRIIVSLLLCLTLVSAGCASTGGKSYTAEEARRVQTVQRGTIVSIQEVTIEQDSSLLGPAIGGVAGGVAGSTIGGGTGRILATVGGAALGAVIGAFGEKAIRSEQAYEFMIDLENNGGTISVVQSADDVYSIGDHVRLLRASDGKTRIVKGQ